MLCSKKGKKVKQKPPAVPSIWAGKLSLQALSSFHASRNKVSQEMWAPVSCQHREFFSTELEGLGKSGSLMGCVSENEARAVTSPQTELRKAAPRWVGRSGGDRSRLSESGWWKSCLLFQFLRIRAGKLSESALLHPCPPPAAAQAGHLQRQGDAYPRGMPSQPGPLSRVSHWARGTLVT